MKLFEIIEVNDTPGDAINIEEIFKYKRSLLTYYRNEFCCEPMLMVTDVFNAVQYGKIVSSNEFHDALNEYLEAQDLCDEYAEHQAEVIGFNSIILEQL